MNRRLLEAIGALLVLSCSETVASPPAPPVNWASLEERSDAGAPAHATEKERAASNAYAKAFTSPGFQGLAPLLADVARATIGSKSAIGRDRVVTMYETVFGAFDDRILAPRRIWLTDSGQAIEWRLSAVHARDWKGIAATHKPIAVDGVALVWTNDDGSIVDVHLFFDELVVRAQLGVGPAGLQKLPLPAPASGPAQVFEQEGPDEANLRVLRGAIDALEDKKESDYLSNMADDVEVFTPEHPQPAHKDQVRAYFATMQRSFAQLSTLPQGGIGTKDYAVMEYSIAGEQIAPVEHVPFVRGRVIRMHIVDIAELRDSKIERLWRYDNPAELEGP